MSPDHVQRVKDLFDEASRRHPGERSAFLDAACKDEPALRAEVESLLAIESSAPHAFMGLPAYQAPLYGPGAGSAGQMIPERIGRYRILRLLGEGGMSVVYLAEQDEPRRTVALKIIRPGGISSSAYSRFRYEAHVLGQLKHDGIAQVYDSGTELTAAGHMPYFAMEFVEGEPLDCFAEQTRLGVQGRLELMARVCDAVHYAHQKGVLHRDLKPANILVTRSVDPLKDVGRPKVLDFGVARAIDSDLQVITLATKPGQIIGTIPYMSPEQLQGDSQQLDVRADVYALGVMTYQILAGKLPHDIVNRSVADAARIVAEADPPTIGTVCPQFRGDVSTIISKAMAKDKARRYQSVAELSADLRRFLANEPILARPPTTLYQLRMFARRNRGLVAGALIGAAALIAGAVLALMQAARATEARNLAIAREASTRRQAYLATINSAASAVYANDARLARRNLAHAPRSLRGWEWHYLRTQLDQSFMSIATDVTPVDPQPYFTRTGGVDGVALSTIEGSPRWHPWTGSSLAPAAPAGTVFAADRSGMVTAELIARTLIVRFAHTGQQRRYHLDDFNLPPFSMLPRLRVSEDGQLVVIAFPMRALAINLETGVVGNRKLENNGVTDLSLIGRSAVAFSAAVRGGPAIWYVAIDKMVPLLEAPLPGTCIAVSTDGTHLVAGLMGNSLRLWHLGGAAPELLTQQFTDSRVTAVAFSPDGTRIVSAGEDRTVRFWDRATLAPLFSLRGHEAGIRGIGFSPDGRLVATYGDDRTLRMWDATSASAPGVLAGHESYVYPVVFSHDGALIASAGWDPTIRLWDARTQELTAVLQRPVSESPDYVISLAFSPDNRKLLSLGTSALRVWDLGTGQIVGSLENEGPYAWTGLSRVGRSYFAAAFTDDGSSVPLLWAVDGPDVPVWAVTNGTMTTRPVAELSIGDTRFISPDGRFVLTSSPRHGEPHEPRSSPPLRRSVLDRRAVPLSAIPSIDGPAVFGNAPSGSIWLAARLPEDASAVGVYNLPDGRQVARLEGHAGPVYAIAFSPDGSRIATGGADQIVRIWDAVDFTELVQLRGHASYVWSLAFSPDGSKLVSGSGDRTVRVWDTITE